MIDSVTDSNNFVETFHLDAQNLKPTEDITHIYISAHL
jgi:hypothetical protein